VTVTDRDRKIMFAFIPVLLLAAYWFLLLGPKRHEASTAADELSVQQERLGVARDKADAAAGAKQHFETTYATVVRLGKAIPTDVDMPSLLVQLDKASAGTGIRFTTIKTGERTPATTTTSTTSTTSTTPAPAAGSESGTNGSPVAAGGQQAQSAPGGAVESANNAQQTSNQSTAAAQNSGVSPSDTQTSTTAGATDTSGQATSPAGLDTVPLDLEFDGDFFHLAAFFHDVKRFVSVASHNVTVNGRLITIEGVRWSSDQDLFPKIKAEISATIYLAPKTQGATAGATPSGPSATTPTTTPAPSTPATTPTATATP
jgi:hypothetical protein